MPTLVSNLWTPSLWIDAIKEQQAKFPNIINSGIVTRSPQFDTIANGAGLTVNMPFFKDITDQADGVQVENTAPTTDNTNTGDYMIGVVCNRETKNSVSAMSAQITGEDVAQGVLDQLIPRRTMQRQKMLISILRGLFNFGGAPNAAAALSATRYGGTTAEVFLEAGASPAAGQCLSVNMFIDMKALMGELGDQLRSGAFLCHTDIRAALEKADASSFKSGVQSGLPFQIDTYRGIPIFTSESLKRAGGTSGYVYDSYLMANGVIALGEKPQQGDTTDVASLQYYKNADLNNEIIYDRTRSIIHPNGCKWVGTSAASSPNNTELATGASWNLVLQSANRTGITCIRTNG